MQRRPLPVRVQPLPEEAFLSWFVRLAHAHGEKVQSLAYQLWGRRRMVGDGLVFRLENADFDELAEICRVSRDALHELTLTSWVGRLWNHIEVKGTRKWVLPTVDRLRRAPRFGQQACTRCLAEDEIPYFRKSWRLAFHCICTVHHCTLIDRCPNCQSPVKLERADVGMFALSGEAVAYRCWMCGVDLRSFRPASDAAPSLIEHQLLLLDVLRRGWLNIGGRVVYSTQFFEGLWVLWSFLDDCRWSKALGVSFVEGDSCRPRVATRKALSHRSPDQRRMLMERAAAYVNNWPERLVVDMRSHKMAGGKLLHFHKGNEALPFWLWEAVHDHLDGSMYVPSEGEVLEAARFVLSRDTTASVWRGCQAAQHENAEQRASECVVQVAQCVDTLCSRGLTLCKTRRTLVHIPRMGDVLQASLSTLTGRPDSVTLVTRYFDPLRLVTGSAGSVSTLRR